MPFTATRGGQKHRMSAMDEDERAGGGAYGVAGAAILAALLLALLLQPVVGLENVDLIFLVAVVAVASRYGSGPALAAAVGSVLAYDVFFLPPLFTFVVSDPRHVTALVLFLVVALVTGHLAGLVRARSQQARRRAQATEALYRFSSRLARLTRREEVARAGADAAGELLGGKACVLLPNASGAFGTEPPSVAHRPFEPFELDALRSAWPGVEAPGPSLIRLGDTWFVSMRTPDGVLGALGAAPGAGVAGFGPAEERVLQALADQTAVALERIRATRQRDAAERAAEAERLRSALLNSLSHDLKTPLASILGAATSLRDYGPLYDPAQRDDLVATITEETERMGRFVTNLLDMARLESGALAPRREPTDLGEVVGTALRRTAALTREHAVSVDVEPGLPLLDLDPVLLEQCVANLVDNAAKFSPAGARIRVACRRTGEAGGVTLAVRDEGPGVPPQDRERVFDLFHQVRRGDRGPAGSGVGLAICRGFVAALGGTVRVEDNPDGPGAAFVIAFPAGLTLRQPETSA